MSSTASPVHPGDLRGCRRQLDEVARWVGARLPRTETRDRLRAYLVGLFGLVQR